MVVNAATLVFDWRFDGSNSTHFVNSVVCAMECIILAVHVAGRNVLAAWGGQQGRNTLAKRALTIKTVMLNDASPWPLNTIRYFVYFDFWKKILLLVQVEFMIIEFKTFGDYWRNYVSPFQRKVPLYLVIKYMNELFNICMDMNMNIHMKLLYDEILLWYGI